MKNWMIGLLAVVVSSTSFAQGRGGRSFSLQGLVTDATTMPIKGAKVDVYVMPNDTLASLTGQNDIRAWLNRQSEPVSSLETNETGLYKMALDRSIFMSLRSKGVNMREAKWVVDIRHPDYESTINITQAEMMRTDNGMVVALGETSLLKKQEKIEAVVVRTKAVEIKGDTTEINANNFKVNPDATAEDLIKKMPGVTERNGDVEAQGEKVQRVLVDGKAYFGEDPKAALKNVPADAISKVQVYDAQSEKSQFTGFDDGDRTKTINIITKTGFKNGRFGKFNGGIGQSIEGTGDDLKYQSGASFNTFSGDRRLSLLFQSNNINQQNFSFDDISSAFSGGNFGRRSMGNLFVQDRGGITQSTLGAINYADKWGKKWDVSGSYFFSNSDNTNDRFTKRYFVTGAQAGLTYLDSSFENSWRQQHRFNARLEWNADSNDRFIFQPRLTFQQSENENPTIGNTFIPESTGYLSQINNLFSSNSTNFNGQLEIDWMHAFKKRGRSLAVEIRPGLNGNIGENNLLNTFVNVPSLDTSLTDQKTEILRLSNTFSAEVELTEQLDSFNSISLAYEMDINAQSNDRLNFVPDYTKPFPLPDRQLDTLLSSSFNNGYSRHAAGLRYQLKKNGVQYGVGLDAQVANLDGDQAFPTPLAINRQFYSLLPQITIRKGSWGSNGFRLYYRTRNNAPSITQLQDVIDNSNPLQLTTGNPNLVQDYQHRLFTRYYNMNPTSGRMFFVFLRGTASQNAITTLTQMSVRDAQVRVPTGDSVYFLRPGAQISSPVNLDGAFDLSGRANWSKPLFEGKINFNTGANFSYRETPSLIKVGDGPEQRNTSKNPSLGFDVGIGSNISERLDFFVNSTTSYNQVNNTLQATLDQTYFIQNTGLQLNWMPKGKWVINTNINHQQFSGLGDEFNQSFFLWNASVGRKFGKKNAWDFRLTCYDILNQNRSINRTVNETYFEDVQTQVLTRYVMAQLTYTLRAFDVKRSPEEEGRYRMMKMYHKRNHR